MEPDNPDAGSPPDFRRLQGEPGAKAVAAVVRVDAGRARSGTEQRVSAPAAQHASAWEPFEGAAAPAPPPTSQWQQRHTADAFTSTGLLPHRLDYRTNDRDDVRGGHIELTPRGARLREPSPLGRDDELFPDAERATPPLLLPPPLMAPVAAPDDELAAAHGTNASAGAGGGGGRGRTLSSPEAAPFGSAAATPGRREGGLHQYAPASALLPFWKRWRARQAVLSPDGVLRLWESQPARLRGAPPVTTLPLHEAMALTPMRTAAVGAQTLFYRSLVDVGRGDTARVGALPAAGFTLRDGDDGGGTSTAASLQLLTYGAPSVGELDAWSCALRRHIAAAHVRQYGASPGGGGGGSGGLADPALVAGGAATLSAADLFLEAMASPRGQQQRRRRRRRSSAFGASDHAGAAGSDEPWDDDDDAGTSSPWRWRFTGDAAPSLDSDGGGGASAGSPAVRVGVTLLDGTMLPLVLPARATVRDALLAVRASLGLRADADFALHLRGSNSSTGRHEFVCLPDVTPLEEAAQLALPEGRALVYKRRIYLPPSLAAPAVSGGGGGSGRRRQPGSAVRDGGGGSSSTVDSDEREDDEALQPQHAHHLPDSPSGAGGGTMTFDEEAAAAGGPHAAAHRLAYADTCYNIAAGNYLLPLHDAVVVAALQLIGNKVGAQQAAPVAVPASAAATKATGAAGAKRGRLTPPVPAASDHLAADTPQPRGFYAAALRALLPSGAQSGDADDLVGRLAGEHARLCAQFDAVTARKLVVKRASQLPEYGAAFYTAELTRTRQQPAEPTGSPPATPQPTAAHAPPAPAWAAAITSEPGRGHPASLPVLVAICPRGVFLRPLAPAPAAATSTGGTGTAGGVSSSYRDASSASPAPAAAAPWQALPMAAIEAWATGERPGGRHVLTLAAREPRPVGLVDVELAGHQAHEMAASMHAAVFAQLAAREGGAGRPRRAARPPGADFGRLAVALRAAIDEAKAAARARAPPGAAWSVIQDPVSGQVAYWSRDAVGTVFSRLA